MNLYKCINFTRAQFLKIYSNYSVQFDKFFFCIIILSGVSSRINGPPALDHDTHKIGVLSIIKTTLKRMLHTGWLHLPSS